MPRKSRRDFTRETKRPPYELDLDDGEFVTFMDPNKLPTDSAFDLAREADPEIALRKLLSEEDFAVWWAEWRKVPIDETNALLDDVLEHYGANRGKPLR